jgi:hypothetical protein
MQTTEIWHVTCLLTMFDDRHAILNGLDTVRDCNPGIPNPGIPTHFAILESRDCSTSIPGFFRDSTISNYSIIYNLLCKFNFTQTEGLDHFMPLACAALRVRRALASAGDVCSKLQASFSDETFDNLCMLRTFFQL